MSADSVLAGRTALLLRDPARAADTVARLAGRGASAAVCRLIDFELPADTADLDGGLRRLLAGEFDWLVLTSVNTVAALGLRARALGVELRIPASTLVAVVGEATARAVQGLGAAVDFMPAHDHSARGMLAEWERLRSGKPARAFMPQADIASSTLRDGLAARGWAAQVVTAYRTVPAPADPGRALHPAAPDPWLPEGSYLLDREQLPGAIGRLDAVFFPSPSTVDQFLNLVPAPAAHLALVAIGDSTAARLRARGIEPTATAAFPTPEGLIGAWEQSRRAAPRPPT
ncbi:uroporphyrinogen-III synthase [Paeniglutamicibacter sp. ABSL32-1]|uniref:uroporphyrinogen-III synthase n=1 Tax=Paeniglutamicibacter quisquiliarum TaxID=2849498 RepID=UPI001C2D77D3|nr:uroporphyrinogen-III synthase [Paeniglutamicibacter quisquiliarum]MBV1779579.1 uroporphyrinogen-III synthase [Paeniglutamicibacter quisquiliarum]